MLRLLSKNIPTNLNKKWIDKVLYRLNYIQTVFMLNKFFWWISIIGRVNFYSILLDLLWKCLCEKSANFFFLVHSLWIGWIEEFYAKSNAIGFNVRKDFRVYSQNIHNVVFEGDYFNKFLFAKFLLIFCL